MSGFAYGDYGADFNNEMLRLLKRKVEMRELKPSEYKRYRRTAVAEMADWTPEFDMEGVSVSTEDILAGSPKPGDKIARNPKNHADRWLVAAAYFEDNFDALGAGCGICGCFLVTIRPRFPGGESREVCPTCLQARIEMALATLSPATYEAKEALK